MNIHSQTSCTTTQDYIDSYISFSIQIQQFLGKVYHDMAHGKHYVKNNQILTHMHFFFESVQDNIATIESQPELTMLILKPSNINIMNKNTSYFTHFEELLNVFILHFKHILTFQFQFKKDISEGTILNFNKYIHIILQIRDIGYNILHEEKGFDKLQKISKDYPEVEQLSMLYNKIVINNEYIK
jgi:hypothetical protein